MKITSQKNKSINECLGVDNESYIKWGKDLETLIVDRYAHKGVVDHVKIIRWLMEEIRFKHLGSTKNEWSAYELELFVGGMIIKYLLLPEQQTSMQIAAYGKQMSDGLLDL